MNEESVMIKVREEMQQLLSGDSTGHDFYHVERVAKLAKNIAKKEGADSYICWLAGLTHDLGRPLEKAEDMPHTGPEALEQIKQLLQRVGVGKTAIEIVLVCVAEHENYSFLGHDPPSSIESRILQDADRLDAIGALGIARTFMFAGAHGHAMWIPDDKRIEWSPERNSSTAIGHFYEKLFKLADDMHTATGKELALERKIFMESYINQFMKEWEGDDL